MLGDKIDTTYDKLEIFPVVRLKFLVSTSKVFKIGFGEFKGQLLQLLGFCHGCRLLGTILTSDPSITLNNGQDHGVNVGCSRKKEQERLPRAARKRRLISNRVMGESKPALRAQSLEYKSK